ncbi:hypothetical protein niasHT_034094 [Heterodera trifolii]|uniref:Nuclear pore protein n=1 Tax=Heterodera trifolii TaxID=157864 RepID=A0ABD2I3G8_9BILA
MGSIFDEIVQRAEKLHSDVRLGGVTELRLPDSSVIPTDRGSGTSFSAALLDAGLDDVFRRSEEIWSRKQSLRPTTVGMGASLKTNQDLSQLSSTRLPLSKVAEKPPSADASDHYEDISTDGLNERFTDAETNKFVQRTIERAQIEAERTFLNQQILERRFAPGESLFGPVNKRAMGSAQPDRTASGGIKHFINLPNAPLSHEQSIFAQKVNETLTSNASALILIAVKESLSKLKSKEAEYIWSKAWAMFPSSIGENWHEKRSSHNWMGHIIDNSTKFLQNEFISHTEATIEANLEKARRGGIPGTLSRILAYLNVKMPSRDPFEDGLFERYPIWTILFYCLRVGDMAEAGRIAKEAKELSNNPHCASLVGILKTLPKSDLLNDERRLKLRAEWNAQNCRDMHKKAIYGLFLGFDCPEVNGTIEDWLWAKLFHCKFAVDPARALRQLQTTLCTQHGERYFVGEGGSHLIYFSVLLLTGQIERAVHVLFRSEYIVHAVHLAILAHQLRLLMTVPKVSDELLTTDVHEPSVCRLNLARLLLLFVKDFELSNIEYAINYCFFARDFKLDTPSADNATIRQEGRSVFVAAVSRIVFMSGHREAILGRLDPQGNRVPGLIDKFKDAMDICELIASIAFDTHVQGHSLAACHLYALAKCHEKAIKLANCQLSMCVSNPMAKETCEMVECAKWLAQQFGQPNMNEENASFSTLILLLKLHNFFRLAAEERHGEAIEQMKSEKMLPMEPDDVQPNVSQFHEVPIEVRPLLPDLCVQSMRSVVALHDITPPASPTVHLLKQFAKALILYSAMIPYRFPVSTNSLLLQLQSKIV